MTRLPAKIPAARVGGGEREREREREREEANGISGELVGYKIMLTCGTQLTVNFCQPSHAFTFGVGIYSISYPLVLTSLI
jgi:hypothetical protein